MIFSYHEKLGKIIEKIDCYPSLLFEDTPVKGIEVVLSDPSVFRSCGKNILNTVRDIISFMKVSTHLPFYDINYGSPDPYVAQYSTGVILEALDVSSTLGASKAVAHINLNRFLPEKGFEKWFKSFMAAKNIIEEKAGSLGIEVSWENTYEENFRVFDMMMAESPETSICLDVGHCNCFAGFTAVDFIERYGRSVRHLHFHDNDGVEDLHLIPGKGNIDFMAVVEKTALTGADTAVFEMDKEDLIKNIRMLKNIFKEVFV